MVKFNKVAFLGAGIWGTALARIAADNDVQVKMWSFSTEQIQEINFKHTNKEYIGDLPLSSNISATNSLTELIKFSNIIVIAIPTKAIKEMLHKLSTKIQKQNQKTAKNKFTFIILSKGFSEDGTLLSDYIDKIAPKNIQYNLVALVGPSLASEVLEKKPTAITAASLKLDLAKKTAETFNNQKYFRVNITKKIDACMMASALKNIYAIGSGIVQGMGYEYNTMAIFITYALKEMKVLLEYFRYDSHIIYDLVGIGDLLVTATNHKSRNFSAGYTIGKENSAKSIYSSATKTTVEGYTSCKIITNRITQKNAKKYPILFAISDILYHQQNPKKVFLALFNNENLFKL